MNRGFTTINLEVVNSGGDCRGDSSAFSYENGLLIQDVIHSNVDIVGEGTRRFTSYPAPSLEVRGPDRWSVSVSLPPRQQLHERDGVLEWRATNIARSK
jgi:hypothetical protein